MTDAAISTADLAILALLQQDPRMPMAELAERTHSSVSPCWRRVRRLEEIGVIAGYGLRLDRKALGFGIDAFVFVQIVSHKEGDAIAFENAVQAVDNILSCHILSGQDDYLLRVVARDLDDYANVARKVIAALPHVREVRSAFVLHTIKDTGRLPLRSPAPPPSATPEPAPVRSRRSKQPR